MGVLRRVARTCACRRFCFFCGGGGGRNTIGPFALSSANACRDSYPLFGHSRTCWAYGEGVVVFCVFATEANHHDSLLESAMSDLLWTKMGWALDFLTGL